MSLCLDFRINYFCRPFASVQISLNRSYFQYNISMDGSRPNEGVVKTARSMAIVVE